MSHNGLRLCSTLNTKITYKKKKRKNIRNVHRCAGRKLPKTRHKNIHFILVPFHKAKKVFSQ